VAGPFAGLLSAQAAITAWVRSYNQVRPHQASDVATPAALFRKGTQADAGLAVSGQAPRRAHCPQPCCRHRLPGRLASSARSPATVTRQRLRVGATFPARSSPSTSRTPTFRVPCDDAQISLHPRLEQRPSRGGKPRSTTRNPSACPATPEPVNQVVSRKLSIKS
jgi:hypothetical protein